MTGSEWLTPAAAAVFVGVFGARVGWTRHASPMLATRVLTAMSCIVTAALVATLVMLALPLAGRSDVLADHTHWSDSVFARGSLALSVLATIALVAALLRVAVAIRAQRRDNAAAKRFRDEVGAAYGDTVVAALDEPDAMALSSGVIVVTDSLARALDAAERRAVLAHERAHLDYRHHRYRETAALLVAANPLLHRLPEATAYLTERWADEEAARATSRDTTAAALKEIARLTGSRHEKSLATMHSAAVRVPDRVLALESEPPRLSWCRLISPAALVTCIVAVALMASERTLDLFQLARAVASVTGTH